MLHQKWLNESPSVIAAYLMEMTPLGKLYQLPVAQQALAQDAATQLLLPFIRTPDLLENETTLIAEWKEQRPAQFQVARGHVEKLGPAYVASKAIDARRNLRLAACRRIDATVTGREAFAPMPAFAGLPYFIEESADLGFAVKVGLVTRASYGTDPLEKGVPAALGVEAIVRFVERCILPFVPEDGSDKESENWDGCWRVWRAMAPAREFEAKTKLLLLPHESGSPIIFSPGSVPAGYVERFTAEDCAGVGVGIEQAVRAGICPYVAKPLADYFAAHPAMIEAQLKPDLPLKHLTTRIASARTAAATRVVETDEAA